MIASDSLITEESVQSCLILVLDLHPQKEESTDDLLLYSYPKNTDIELLKGVAVTSIGACFDIFGESTTDIVFQQQKLSMAIEYFSEFIAIALIIPIDSTHIRYFHYTLLQDLCQFLYFLYPDIESEFLNIQKHNELDSLFKMFFKRFNSRTDNTDLFLSSVKEFLSFPISLELEIKISEELNTFMGSLNNESSQWTENCRPFLILGCCLFFQGKLLLTHLNTNLTKNISRYVKYTNLLDRTPESPEVIIIENIHVTEFSKRVQYVLVVFASKTTLLCSVLQDNSITQYGQNNPYYLDEMRKCLLNLNNDGLLGHCENEMKSLDDIPCILRLPKSGTLLFPFRMYSLSTSETSRKHREAMISSFIFNAELIREELLAHSAISDVGNNEILLNGPSSNNKPIQNQDISGDSKNLHENGNLSQLHQNGLNGNNSKMTMMSRREVKIHIQMQDHNLNYWITGMLIHNDVEFYVVSYENAQPQTHQLLHIAQKYLL